ncbi:MAG TPA: PepSY domain-containing protein [Gaiellaceae bacterium]|nr:PepSY domain-containing protein [Gaiellaceae bacterium]
MPRRGLRDHPLGKILLLAVVLVAALLVARTCGSHNTQITQEEAVAIAKENAAFTPCEENGCVVVRAVQRGIPPRLVWIVGLAENLDEDGEPTRFENILVDAQTGEIVRR